MPQSARLPSSCSFYIISDHLSRKRSVKVKRSRKTCHAMSSPITIALFNLQENQERLENKER
ncbi:hypothetical protein M419DRAFT_135018 [Trichoderma reesei RUT C-30]|uniref:Uncharacterized protein n=1 Tax=Hypocrea jecorina (strain ATCC 56765 / BCRC 32924 / NRRL 11460 / Rut C-30) TaxID=1344414 RepID=A0A024RY55_HYPJR|nr:hypothetical protein M419DRAFT_135018 [Trichoderma reesei RUT C-30]